MTVTLRYQSTGIIPGSGDPMVMIGPSLSIGRGNENDVVLPDPDRMLSKRHCVVENHNGNVVVVDISTNGTFLNYGKVALGGTQTPLNNGDILTLGPYELLVEISEDGARDPTQNIADPLLDGPVSHGNAVAASGTVDLLDGQGGGDDFLDDLLSGREPLAGPGGVQRDQLGEDGLMPPLGDDGLLPPLEDEADVGIKGGSIPSHTPSASDNFRTPEFGSGGGGGSVIPDDWDEDFLSPNGGGDPFAEPEEAAMAPPPPAAPAFIPDDDPLLGGAPVAQTIPAEPEAPVDLATEQVSEREDATALPGAPAATPISPPVTASLATGGADDAAARAFLKAAGAQEVRIDADELTPTLTRMGHVMRIMIHGMREILMTRTSIKSEFRIEQTMIRAGGNNPLKFSITPEQAVEALVRPSSKGYLEATDAAEEALRDIKAHEVAMVTGMEAALKGVLKRLDPAVLEDKIQGKGGIADLLKSKKARYWEIYETMFAEISDQAENDFHELFSKEFAKAYKDQLERLK